MRIFINNVDSYVGKALCADLRSIEGQDNKLFGTVSAPGGEVDASLIESLGVKRVVSRTNVKTHLADILSCSLIVFDLHGADLADAEAVIKHIKLAKLEHDTTFVLISSVSVWAQTKTEDVSLRSEEEGEPEAEEEAAPGDTVYLLVDNYADSRGVPQYSRGKVLDAGDEGQLIVSFPAGKGSYKTAELKKEQFRPEVLTDAAKERRTPREEFLPWKYLETLTLSLGPKEKLRPHVISAGVLYGNGEVTFNELFKAAWLTLPAPAHVITKLERKGGGMQPGTNYIPCVHVRDVARLARVVSIDSTVKPFLIAVDKSRLTQAEIIWGIVKEMSNKTEVPALLREDVEAKFLDVFPSKEKKEHLDVMTLDVLMEPSDPMKKKDFDWWCKKGLVENMKTVADEFCRWRNLRHIKSVVVGPPGAGAERYCTRIAEQYLHQDPPHLTYDMILDDAMNAGTPAANNLRRKVEKIRAIPGKELKLKIRTKLVKKRLMSNVCRYRGYVLEGYPRTFAEAEALFMEPVPDPEADEPPPEENEDEAEGEEEEEEEEPAPEAPDPWEDEEEGEDSGPKTQLNKDIAPEFVVELLSTEERCRQRVFEGGARFSGVEAEFARQTLEHSKANLSKDGRACNVDFFVETGGVKALKVDVDKQTDEEIFQVIRVYLESKGQFFNYLRSDEEIVAERQAKIVTAEQKAAEEREKQREVVNTQEDELRQQRKKEEAGRRQVIAEQEASVLEAESMPLQQYLMVNVVPTLTEGLSEVAKTMPEDPIEYLAQYLFAHAQDIGPQLEAAANRGGGESSSNSVGA